MHARTRHANHVRLPDHVDSTRWLSLTPTRTHRGASRSAISHLLRLRWTRRSLRLSTIHALLRLWLHVLVRLWLHTPTKLEASRLTALRLHHAFQLHQAVRLHWAASELFYQAAEPTSDYSDTTACRLLHAAVNQAKSWFNIFFKYSLIIIYLWILSICLHTFYNVFS